MPVNNETEAGARASELLGIPQSVLSVIRLPEDRAWMAAEPMRGGSRLVMSQDDESVLWAGPALSEQGILEAWRAGRRTEQERFNELRERNSIRYSRDS
ncbi:MAG: hypothetical protein LBJ02_05080 [Bifidobacteriaceae bacterium]|jgi:hypothetical protein|nr:hypothetical protein [Bifidobacteriaceae bacterium]